MPSMPQKERTMRKIIFPLAVLLITLACSMLGDPSQFERSRAKWNAANITHYQFNLSISCFCPYSEDMPLAIEVDNGKVVSMTKPDGSSLDSDSPLYSDAESYNTIDQAFSSLELLLNGDADKVEVTYDPAYGFPTSIDVDMILNAVDDEFSIYISDFKVLNP